MLLWNSVGILYILFWRGYTLYSVQNVCANETGSICKLQMLNDYTYWLLMWTHLHIWRQHLLHAHSCVCPTDCCGSPQVGSQYQYKLHCPDEWAQFPGQRRHVGRVLTLNGECNECNLIVHTIWIKSMLLIIFFFTFKWLNDYLCFNKLLQNFFTCDKETKSLPTDPNPSCLQTTLASGTFQKSSHTVPHVLL